MGIFVNTMQSGEVHGFEETFFYLNDRNYVKAFSQYGLHCDDHNLVGGSSDLKTVSRGSCGSQREVGKSENPQVRHAKHKP